MYTKTNKKETKVMSNDSPNVINKATLNKDFGNDTVYLCQVQRWCVIWFNTLHVNLFELGEASDLFNKLTIVAQAGRVGNCENYFILFSILFKTRTNF